MSTVCLIPIKKLETAKSRLSSHFSNNSRREIFMYMLRRTIETVNESTFKECWLLSSDPEIEIFAKETGNRVFPDCAEGLNSTLKHYISKVFVSGYNAMYLAPDLPLIDQNSLLQMLEVFDKNSQIVIVPDLDKKGINSIIWRKNNFLGPYLGFNSYQRHIQQAKNLNKSITIFETPQLQTDLDTIDQFNNLPDSIRSKLLSLG